MTVGIGTGTGTVDGTGAAVTALTTFEVPGGGGDSEITIVCGTLLLTAILGAGA
jgi:hypothetical protein